MGKENFSLKPDDRHVLRAFIEHGMGIRSAAGETVYLTRCFRSAKSP
jgi:hypothetical protein